MEEGGYESALFLSLFIFYGYHLINLSKMNKFCRNVMC